ncbi:hypothetical protein MVEN_01639400 [Mycena venus]|uniref:Uncharacterized protein n=1 Tax=Mycena venus TaxID=2733690 RepID=A0A8H6XNX0_9AGAR|nr:hypothetical protein MVEN_01639400 [Mycena venus]
MDGEDDDGVDHSLAHIPSSGMKVVASRKGKVEQIEWDEELEELEREKASTEAIWGAYYLKSSFRAKSEKLRKSAPGRPHPASSSVVEAPPLHLPDGSQPPPKGAKEEMQDFLDDLLT